MASCRSRFLPSSAARAVISRLPYSERTRARGNNLGQNWRPDRRQRAEMDAYRDLRTATRHQARPVYLAETLEPRRLLSAADTHGLLDEGVEPPAVPATLVPY